MWLSSGKFVAGLVFVRGSNVVLFLIQTPTRLSHWSVQWSREVVRTYIPLKTPGIISQPAHDDCVSEPAGPHGGVTEEGEGQKKETTQYTTYAV